MTENRLSTRLNKIRVKKTKIKTAKNRPISSTRWLSRQLNDPYYLLSKQEGYRSRAAYKLAEIQEKFDIFRPGYNVIDLGAAPGGWSQIADKYVNNNKIKGKIIAIDKLPMDLITNVHILQKDFLDQHIEEILKNLHEGKFDVIMSDMAPSTSGDTATDHIRILDLCELAFHFAQRNLKVNGSFIAKIFVGGTEKNLLNLIKKQFGIVKHFKPNSSRKDSKEMFLIAKNFKNIELL